MYPNPQYEYDFGPDGVLAPLQERSEYPDSPYMISPPVGWVELVLELNENLSSILPDYTIAQVKEKFASLRYYVGEYGCAKDDPRIAIAKELIQEAESLSMRTCQVCGQPGVYEMKSGRFCATMCAEHTR